MDCRLVIACALAGLLTACQPPPPRQQLDAEQLHLQAKKLSGLCAQGALLAETVQQRRVAHAFAYVEQQAVAASAQKAIAELSRPAGAGVRDGQQALLQLAIELQLTVTRIAGAQGDDTTLQAVRARLRALGTQAGQLAPGAA